MCPFAYPVACCCVFLGVGAQSLKPVKRLALCKQTQHCWDLLRPFACSLILTGLALMNSLSIILMNYELGCSVISIAIAMDNTQTMYPICNKTTLHSKTPLTMVDKSFWQSLLFQVGILGGPDNNYVLCSFSCYNPHPL